MAYYNRTKNYLGAQIKLNKEALFNWLKKHQPDHPLVEELENTSFSYNKEAEISLYSINNENIQAFYDFVAEQPDANSNTRKVKAYQNLLKTYTTKCPKNLENLATVLMQFTKEKTFRCSYVTEKYGIPFLVRAVSIEYNPTDVQSNTPASTLISFSYAEKNKKCSTHASFHIDDLKDDKTVEQLLTEEGFRPATEEDYNNYLQRYELYCGLVQQVGKQFVSKINFKTRTISKSSWDSTRVTVSRGSKLVIDTEDDFKLAHLADSVSYFNLGSSDRDAHQYPSYNSCLLDVFSLSLKENVEMYVDFIEPYKYNDTIKDQLVLPEDHKNCLDILMNYDPEDFSDVIKDKSAGIVILASGDPGLGKSLSAETYAELIHKPLYQVQSSELGIDTDSIEENLQTVLNRASKWHAVLLLDEADTFIRRRGNDLQQNAIVGVFLRVLEYYKGVLFMTTNRFVDAEGKIFVDDAILSRATAHIRYDYPEEDAQLAILKVQCNQLEVKIDEADAKTIVDFFKQYQISGRDIRNFVKLSKMFIRKDNLEKLTLETIKKVLPFHATLNKQ